MDQRQGLTTKYKAEYDAYKSAKRRCTNVKDKDYPDYGGRGIEFRFASFSDFIQELGPRPTGLSLDRPNNNGHYELGNIRWADSSTQKRNRRSYAARDRRYLDVCYSLAQQSPCVKARVGAVVVKKSKIRGSGYNHSPNPECDDCANLCAGGIRAGVKSGTRLELCHAVHAEQWAIHEAGPRAKGATLYVASFDDKWNKRLKDATLPLGHIMHGFYCSMCARACWMAGISRIVTDGVNGIVEFTPEEIWNTSYGVAGSI